MSSIRLRADQIARLRKDGYAARCIDYAIRRWRRGDFEITPARREPGAEPLQVFPIWKKPEGVTDAELRAVLDAHWSTPDKVLQEQCDREIAYWDGIIEAEFAKLAARGPYIEVPPDGEGERN